MEVPQEGEYNPFSTRYKAFNSLLKRVYDDMAFVTLYKSIRK